MLDDLQRHIECLVDAVRDIRLQLINCIRVADDPQQSITLARSIAESVTKKLLKCMNCKVSTIFEACLKELEKHEVRSRGLVPAEIISMLHMIRVMGNKASHGASGIELTSNDVAIVLSSLLRVVEWYYSQFRLGPQINPILAPPKREPPSAPEDGTFFGELSIVAAPRDNPPFASDAIVWEEDTFQVMSASIVGQEVEEHPVRVTHKAYTVKPVQPGTLLVKDGSPLKFLAIVYDFDEDPSSHEEWVANALDKIFTETDARKLKSLALPLLGTSHGSSLKKERFITIFQEALHRASLGNLKKIWLITTREMTSEVVEILKSEFEDGAEGGPSKE